MGTRMTKAEEALQEVRRLGALSAKGLEAKLAAFECSEADVDDAFENACQNARAACEKAGVDPKREADAWHAGWAAVKDGLVEVVDDIVRGRR